MGDKDDEVSSRQPEPTGWDWDMDMEVGRQSKKCMNSDDLQLCKTEFHCGNAVRRPACGDGWIFSLEPWTGAQESLPSGDANHGRWSEIVIPLAV